MGSLRWRGELDFWIQQLSGKALDYFDPEILTILRLGLYQIQFLERIPKSAAVNEAVELTKVLRKRSAAGLVNAVLRKCERVARWRHGRGWNEPDAESLESACRSLPTWLAQRWTRHFGPEAMKRLAWASVNLPPVNLRVVGRETSREEAQNQLAEEGVVTRPGRYGSQTLVVESGNVQSSRTWRQGKVVIQDEASQLVAELVGPEAGQCLLDLCAAPGIKTSQLAAALSEGRLVASDLSARRVRTMARLLPKLTPAGLRVHLVRLDATCELPFGLTFDRVLLDALCSGTGTLARNPEIKWRLEPEDLRRLGDTQVKMLRNALAVLTPGGRLVYATCSLEPEENEQVVEKVLLGKPSCRLLTRAELAREFPRLSPVFDAHGYFRTRPDLHSMDGFFAAVIVRTA